jgi:L-amino acid N-acyltransferase YncA
VSDELAIVALLREDWEAVRAIYQEGIETRQATFETTVPAWDKWDAAKRTDCRLVLRKNGTIIGWAALNPVSGREVYRGVAESSIYIAQAERARGYGRLLLAALVEASEAAGIWTLQATVFPENEASFRLHRACGFRVVGVRERIGQHYGRWRDTCLLERRSDVIQ